MTSGTNCLTPDFGPIEYGHPRGSNGGEDGSRARSLVDLLAVGTVLVVCIVLGYFLGSYLDRRLGTSPWMLVVGVLLGTAAGFVQLFRTVSRSLK